MNTVLLSVKLEPGLKKDAQKIASLMGVNLTTVIKVKLKEFVRTKELNISLNEVPSTRFTKILKNADKEPKSPAFKNSKDAVKWLKNQDEN